MARERLRIIGLLSAMLLIGYGCKNQAFGPSASGQNPVASEMAMHKDPGMMMNPMQRNYTAHLSGRNEVPTAVNTNATGEAIFHISKDGKSISYKLITSNIDNLLMAHIHIGTPSVNGPITVWLYPESGPPPHLISGRFDGVLATGTITAKDLMGPLQGDVLDSLITRIKNGDAYVQVHTVQHKTGEIRGQIK